MNYTNSTSSADLIILDLIPQSMGWLPVKHLVTLLKHFLNAEVVTLPEEQRAIRERIRFKLTRRKFVTGRPQLLVVIPRLNSLSKAAALPEWSKGFERLSVWVIDSFWTKGLKGFPGLQNVDHMFITWGGDLETYRAATKASVDCLPWGTDALGMGSTQASRPIDVLRLGRQPIVWADDTVNLARFEKTDLTFAGRPSGTDQTNSYHALLTNALQKAKCVLAHTNFADPEPYTHPTKEYMTARWTDAFACGCLVGGMPPVTDPLFDRVDQNAIVHFDPGANDAGLDALCDGVRAWTPELARHIHDMALREFDWRWRIRDLAQRLELPTAKVEADLLQIEQRLKLPAV